jgi:hypothetical protein
MSVAHWLETQEVLMSAPARRSRFATVLSAVTAFLFGLAPLPTAQGSQTSDLQVQASSVQSLESGYLQVEGVMSGNVIRDDGSQGRYRVPVTLVYPEDAARCAGDALVDVINSVFYETFDFAGTAQDPFFPSLLPGARLLMGDGFLEGRGYVYAHGSGTSWLSSGNVKLARSRTRRSRSSGEQTATRFSATFPTSCVGLRSCSLGRLLRPAPPATSSPLGARRPRCCFGSSTSSG